ncbi:alanine--tRNA ligase, partial [Patescibacteria group bacterium]|nr:alanine--tRNA ligase [Patescibacteria group bacterium]
MDDKMPKLMSPNELRRSFLNFYQSKGHAKISSSPLVPENDSTTLFNSSGMQPLVPFLLGELHPEGQRLVNSQLCFRADDIEEVGDNRHTTFFEMLGNWSLGSYFKAEQLAWFFEFLTQVVGLDPNRLYVSVFAGNEEVPRDDESAAIWQDLFQTKEKAKLGEQGFDPKIKIYLYEAKKNWWSRSGEPDLMPPGEIGGPDSEVFFDFDPKGSKKIHKQSSYAPKACHINCDCGRFLEIGNSVFIEYRKNNKGSFDKLEQRNVDFGGGFERILAAQADQSDIFQTKLFWPLIQLLQTDRVKYEANRTAMRVVVDHLRGAVFMARENIKPANKQQGYLMRRLIRRAVVKLMTLSLPPEETAINVCRKVVKAFTGVYFDGTEVGQISSVLTNEVRLFAKTARRAIKKLDGASLVTGEFLFDLHQSYGLLFELASEILAQRGQPVTSAQKKSFKKAFKLHQEKSRTASEGMFKGGLADSSTQIVGYHTVTHLLHQALRDVLGNNVQQAGSNITNQRLRFDFVYSEKLTEDQLAQVQVLVNEKIKAKLPVAFELMSLVEAKKKGALAFFAQKYDQKVKVYSVGDYSREVCGGPHVS